MNGIEGVEGVRTTQNWTALYPANTIWALDYEDNTSNLRSLIYESGVESMRPFLLLALLCPLLQGCLGVVVLKPHKEVIGDPVVAYIPNDADPAHERKPLEETNAVVYSSEWLQSHWGDPYRVSQVPGKTDEVWTYRFRPIWVGVVPLVIVPIPLALPVGRERICFTVRDGCVISATRILPWCVGGVAGFVISPEGGGNFGAAWLNEQGPN